MMHREQISDLGKSLPSVKDILNDPPGSPALGDRYIVGVGTGLWSTHDNKIAVYNGTSWDFEVSEEHSFLVVETSPVHHFFQGGIWSASGYSGTNSQTFAFDSNAGSHFLVKNNSGEAQLRNQADSDFADLVVNALTVKGNLIVQGSTIQVDSQIETADSVILMNEGELGAGVTLGYSGLELDRGSLSNFWLGFDEVRDAFSVGEITTLSSAQIANTQLVATREDSPSEGYYAKWNDSDKRIDFVNNIILGGDGFNIDSSGRINLIDGTSLFPAIRFDSDQDTGIYKSASNKLTIVAGGASQLTISQTSVSVAQLLSVGQRLSFNSINYFGLALNSMTTSERDGASGESPIDGHLIYNSTVHKAQLRANGTWVDLN